MRVSTLLLAALILTAPAAAHARPNPEDMLRKADLDQNGTTTRPEFRQARAEQFSKFDRNGDGYLGKDDVPRRARRAGSASGRMAELMEAFDLNRDGRLARDEFIDGPALAFDRADTDHNDRVDPAEMRIFHDWAAAQSR